MLVFGAIISLSAVLAICEAGNYTVTEEVWFEVKVKDLNGPGKDFKGRFTIAVFGETAPMTALNFVSITRGYKRGRVSFISSIAHIVVQRGRR